MHELSQWPLPPPRKSRAMEIQSIWGLDFSPWRHPRLISGGGVGSCDPANFDFFAQLRWQSPEPLHWRACQSGSGSGVGPSPIMQSTERQDVSDIWMSWPVLEDKMPEHLDAFCIDVFNRGCSDMQWTQWIQLTLQSMIRTQNVSVRHFAAANAIQRQGICVLKCSSAARTSAPSAVWFTASMDWESMAIVAMLESWDLSWVIHWLWRGRRYHKKWQHIKWV